MTNSGAPVTGRYPGDFVSSAAWQRRTRRKKNEAADPAIRVLIVDNDKHHARAMAESLERVGYHCDVATSGPEGASRIDEDVFDLVVTDLMMNDVDGMAILSRAKESLEDCEVIMITGHATVPRAVEAMRQGAFNFIEKANYSRPIASGRRQGG